MSRTKWTGLKMLSGILVFSSYLLPLSPNYVVLSQFPPWQMPIRAGGRSEWDPGVKEAMGRFICTLGFLAEFSFIPLLYHPGECLGCPEKQTSSRNYNLFVWVAVFQKTNKNNQKLLLFGISSEFIQCWLKNSSPNP